MALILSFFALLFALSPINTSVLYSSTQRMHGKYTRDNSSFLTTLRIQRRIGNLLLACLRILLAWSFHVNFRRKDMPRNFNASYYWENKIPMGARGENPITIVFISSELRWSFFRIMPCKIFSRAFHVKKKAYHEIVS